MMLSSLSGGLFFVSLLGYALLLMLLMPKLKSGSALLSSLCGMLMVSYYGVIVAGIMIPVAYALMGVGLAGFVIGLVAIIKNGRNLRTRVGNVGMLFFVVTATFIVFASQGVMQNSHDDFSFWKRAVRELYLFDQFYINPEANGMMYHTDYIPLFASLQYCVVRVFGWQDAFLCFPTLACLLTGIALLSDFFKRKWIPIVLGVLTLYIFPALGFYLLVIRADGWMCALFAVGLIHFLFRKDNHASSLLPIVMICAVIAGTKIYAGLMMGAVLCIALFGAWVKQIKSKGTDAKPLGIALGLSLLLMLGLHFSWSIVYNWTTAIANGETASLLTLLQGNPRTQQLSTTLSFENFQQANALLLQAMSSVLKTKQSIVWIAGVVLALVSFIFPKEQRKKMHATFALLLTCAILYIAGLYASFFVQAETINSAYLYLATITTPFAVWILFSLLWQLDQSTKMPALATWGASLLVCAIVMGYWITPTSFWNALFAPKEESYSSFTLAEVYFEDYVADQISDDDAGKRAVLFDCSWDASQLASESYVTHSYQYYALPMRTTIYQIPYEDYRALDYIHGDWLDTIVAEGNYEIVLLRVEDEIYWDAFANMMDVYDDGERCAIYDVVKNDDGSYEYVCRAEW